MTNHIHIQYNLPFEVLGLIPNVSILTALYYGCAAEMALFKRSGQWKKM